MINLLLTTNGRHYHHHWFDITNISCLRKNLVGYEVSREVKVEEMDENSSGGGGEEREREFQKRGRRDQKHDCHLNDSYITRCYLNHVN